jgi:membrane-associated phospholipid phosphatase
MGDAATRERQRSSRVHHTRRWPGPLAARALAIALATAGALFALQWVALRTTDGQRLDERSFGAFQRPPWSHLNLPAQLLSDVSVGTAIVACAVIGAVALIQGRIRYAVAAALMVAGANVTVQVLKHVVLERTASAVIAPNSFPSGHVCVVASLVMAALLVLPAALRTVFAVPGAIWITMVGASTLIAAWHRVSDVVAALLVCLGWAALAAGLLGWSAPWRPRGAGPIAIWWVCGLAAVGLAVGLAGLTITTSAADIGSRPLLAITTSVVIIGLSSAAVTAIWCRLLSALAAEA